MGHPALTVAVGFASGVLAGAFGIGGGLLTTPAIRLLLGYPALVAVGTPLPVIVPTAMAGAVGYARRGLADLRAAGIMGAVGAAAAVGGASLTRITGGRPVLAATALLLAWAAVDMLRRLSRPPAAEEATDAPEAPVAVPVWRLAVIGLFTGLYSGFLGLGGGFVVVPALTRWLRWPLKRAIGTSLATISLLAIPGSVAHYLLGNVDLTLASLLAAGAVPGAVLGARLTSVASERHVAIGFAVLLIVTALALGWSVMA